MKISLHRIITKDYLELVGLLHEPETPTKKILVHVHGMAGNFYENSFLDAIATTLTSHGIAFFVFNNRGCELIKDMYKVENGKRHNVRIGNAYEIFEECVLDIDAALSFVKSQGFSEIHLSGHSLGAPKVAHYVAEGNNDKLASVIFISPADMVGLVKLEKNSERDMTLSKKMIAEGNGAELLPTPVLWDESILSANTFVNIGSEESPVAIFNFHNPTDPLEVLSKITIPTFVVMGRGDDALTVPIEEVMERIEKAIHSEKVKTHILGDANHGYTHHEQQLADVIEDWVR